MCEKPLRDESVPLLGQPKRLDDGGSSRELRTKLWRWGVVAILVLVVVSVTQAETAQALQASTHFTKPFFISCFNHAITVLLLPTLFLVLRSRDQRAGFAAHECGFTAVLQRHSSLPLSKLVRIAVVLNTVYIAADYLWFTALGISSVSASTTISNTAPFFVYLFSMCFLHERACWYKIGGVAMSFVGVTLVALFQDESSNDFQRATLVASLLVVVQTMIVAAYGVAYRVFVGEEVVDVTTVLILTGFCGVATIPLWVVGSLILSLCSLPAIHEPLGWPDTAHGMLLLVISGSLAGAYTLLQSLALCWTTPLLTCTGAMLTIPLSLLWDTTLNHRVFTWQCLLGAVFVMAGFALLEARQRKL